MPPSRPFARPNSGCKGYTKLGCGQASSLRLVLSTCLKQIIFRKAHIESSVGDIEEAKQKILSLEAGAAASETDRERRPESKLEKVVFFQTNEHRSSHFSEAGHRRADSEVCTDSGGQDVNGAGSKPTLIPPFWWTDGQSAVWKHS
ncbi:unnamed protein product [Protopolystoma xenopodis]|uniref:Uncharacterized protein n=1 Tax=Protopolystoma xenopodis TaxID=117903 RepID=A0A448WD57_9PLAT|nr:unnamed protein product [Protopolystoma xenopodis]